MGAVGVLALRANAGVAALLFAYREGDANMRSVWICSRNDAIANVAVVLAAFGVFGTGTGWPDVIVAAVIAWLSLWCAAQKIRQGRAELPDLAASVRPATVAAERAFTERAVSQARTTGPLPSRDRHASWLERVCQ